MAKCDFSGWATRNDLKCADGRVIRKNAFIGNDGKTVPLVWNHQHNEPENVLGHALLKNRDTGVYAYCTFNDTESGKNAKLLVQHGDVCSLSIYANQLKQQGENVLHGAIREVSLVLAGANPGAFIDSIMMHGEESDDEAIVYTGEEISLEHSFDDEEKEPEKEPVIQHAEKKEQKEEPKMAEKNEKTVKEVFDTLTEEQKTVVYAMIGAALEEKDNADDEEEEAPMKHNLFDNDNYDDNVISHSDMQAVIDDAKRYGSMKESALAHGITDIETLFPEPTNLNNPPEWISRSQSWVKGVMNSVHHTPFSRIKSSFANITEDEARAKGYIKGKLKKDEVFSLLKRTTTPTTIYKKQKLDRDDVIDITDFDVVSWLKAEMRMMLDEEIARAILIGDGRINASDDKINESNIRPISKDEDLYTVKVVVASPAADTADVRAKKIIREVVKSRKNYKGSGSPKFYTTEDVVTDMLLLEDNNGRIIYTSEAELAKALRVSEIITVPVMEGAKGVDDKPLIGLIVNLTDYNVGADKGGAVNLFDDFDIDYNAQKYLIETRCSGALTKPYSAIAITLDEA